VDKLLYVIGKGSCSSPILWALLNQLIMTALGEKFDCIKLVSVDNSTTNTRPGDSFVEDTTMGVTSDDTASDPVPIEVTDLTADEAELIGQMQVVIQFFLDLLQVTCGDLAPEKCVVTYRTQVEERRTSIISKKSESSWDKYHIQRNRTNIRN
jgi:hypothetical protein